MAKGYWVAQVDVTDMDTYKKYVAAIQEPLAKYCARYVTRGGETTFAEGASRERVVIIEFASYEQALACYNSPEYKQAATFRKDASAADITIVEGYDGPQPGD